MSQGPTHLEHHTFSNLTTSFLAKATHVAYGSRNSFLLRSYLTLPPLTLHTDINTSLPLMAASNTTLHLPTIPPIPSDTADMSTATASEEGNHIPLPSPALLDTYIVTCVLLLLAAALMVGLKFALTWAARGRFGKDDVMILAGLLTLIATGIVGGEAYHHGLGKPTTLIDGPSGKYSSWRAFYWEYLFYTVWYVPLCFSKLAFFFMYTRTFHGKKMKRTLWVSMFIFTALTILFITGTQLMSEGIKQSGLEAIKALRYHVQFKYLHYAWGTCDILADLWICVLPLAGLKVLKISFKRRLELTLKFAVPAITFIISMIRIYELNLVMGRDIVQDHTWDPSIAETVPVLWALIQAAAAVIITTLPSLALRFAAWYRKTRAARSNVDPEAEPSVPETAQSESPKEETGGRTPTTSFVATLSSEPTSSHKSNRSKAEKILGMGQRFKRSRTPDEYSEEDHRMGSISGITVTRTVNVTSALDPEEGFRHMYRKYCGQA